MGGNGDAGVLVEVRSAGMQGQKFLCPVEVLEAELTPFLIPGGPVGLFNEIVAAHSGNDLEVLDTVEHRESPNGCPVAPELIRVNDVWHVIVDQKLSKKGLCCLGVSPILQKEVKNRARFVDRPPQPKFFATNLDTHLIQEPPGTPPGFPVSQFFGEEGGEPHVPLAERLVTDSYTALLEEFLDITLTEGEAVVQPKSVLDDAQRKPVAVRLTVSHGRSAYRA
ncbi:hypothetical protein HNQ08_005361 [Deinococcus humi]|uniref:Uncharacterized protein n=1 Tax=Deinococcus humi TaxID=662880 RepID=A0A7W8JZS3_9DEIO|nr:hypothetical protein [Deinococcus humi]GGO40935.1 hypothetical protein GCM10008949_51070 [Deinococcus humi]